MTSALFGTAYSRNASGWSHVQELLEQVQHEAQLWCLTNQTSTTPNATTTTTTSAASASGGSKFQITPLFGCTTSLLEAILQASGAPAACCAAAGEGGPSSRLSPGGADLPRVASRALATVRKHANIPEVASAVRSFVASLLYLLFAFSASAREACQILLDILLELASCAGKDKYPKSLASTSTGIFGPQSAWRQEQLHSQQNQHQQQQQQQQQRQHHTPAALGKAKQCGECHCRRLILEETLNFLSVAVQHLSNNASSLPLPSEEGLLAMPMIVHCALSASHPACLHAAWELENSGPTWRSILVNLVTTQFVGWQCLRSASNMQHALAMLQGEVEEIELARRQKRDRDRPHHQQPPRSQQDSTRQEYEERREMLSLRPLRRPPRPQNPTPLQW